MNQMQPHGDLHIEVQDKIERVPEIGKLESIRPFEEELKKPKLIMPDPKEPSKTTDAKEPESKPKTPSK